MNIRYGMLSNNVAKKEMLFFEAKDILKRIILCIFSCEKKAKIAPVRVCEEISVNSDLLW